jgi:peptidoglycan/xylan/chitin deacetylase (PgdA/CDA1 family)
VYYKFCKALLTQELNMTFNNQLRGNEGQEPWRWEDDRWQKIIGKVRAGKSLKPKQWENGSKVAVAISFDSDHESTTLRLADDSPGRLSQGQYGGRVAMPRIRKVLSKYNIPASFFVPAVVAKIHPEEQRALVDDGHEIGIHGWIHELNSELPPENERDLMLRASDVLEQTSGYRPVGMRTPSWDFSQHTLSICREMGLLYDSSLMADDDPYELMEDGQPTGVVELPVEWIRDDAPYFNMDRFTALRPYTAPSTVLEIFKAEFDGAMKEGGLFLLTLHPHISGHRSRIVILEELIEYIKSFKGVWFATHAEIALFCKNQDADQKGKSNN